MKRIYTGAARLLLAAGVAAACFTAGARAQEAKPSVAPMSMDAALASYTRLVRELAARDGLPEHSWGSTYLRDRETVQEYTDTSIPGMYSLRNVRPDDPAERERWVQNMGVLFEWRPIVFFTADGNGFYVRKDHFAKGPDSWLVYDKHGGGYKTGEPARPYIQQMLTVMNTSELPVVGKGRPTFILYTSPSCPYSLEVEPLLAKSGLSYRIFPTYTVNPRSDIKDVHRIFCAKDRVAAWKDSLRRRKAAKGQSDNDDKWWCQPTVMPVLTLADLDFIFGQGYPTPSFYFPDGTVITGADSIELVKAKSKEMVSKNLYFR